MRNSGIKLLSVIIAALLCFWVNSEGNSSEIEFVAPIDLRGLPDNRVVLEQSARQVQVSVKGPSSLVTRLASSPQILKVKVPNDSSSRVNLPLRSEDLGLPPYVRVLRLEPSELTIKFDTLVSRTLPVIVPRIGQLDENQQISDLRIEPEKVNVAGPERIVAELNQVETLPLDLRGLRSDIKRNFSLRSPNPAVRIDHEEVEVSLKVAAIQTKLKLEQLPIELRVSAGQNLALAPSRVSVEISGPVAAIKSLRRELIVPYVRPKGDIAQESAEVFVDHPDEITVVKVEPEKVAVVRGANSAVRLQKKK